MSMLFKRIKDWAVSIASFRTGDVIPVDGPSGTAKMSKDDLLKESAQNALAGNLAPAFDPTRTEENKYLAGQSVVHNSKLKTFINDHYGPWSDSDAVDGPISDEIEKIKNKFNCSELPNAGDSISIEDGEGEEIARVDKDGLFSKNVSIKDENGNYEQVIPKSNRGKRTVNCSSFTIEDDNRDEILKINEDGLFAKNVFIKDENENYENVKDIISSDAVDVVLPNRLTAVVGDTFQLFFQGCVKAIFPELKYNLLVTCQLGKQFPRYFEVTPTISNVGSYLFKLTVKRNDGEKLGEKTCIIDVVNKIVSSPATSNKVVCIGDSLTEAGNWCAEAFRRLTGTGGAPEGDGLSNIEFCGSMTKNGAGYFGKGGWSWADYVTPRKKAYRFQVSGVSTLTYGSVYSNDGNLYTVIENNTTDGNGSILCSVTENSTYSPDNTGILTKVSGSGDSEIHYSSFALDTQNPFWDNSEDKLSFRRYAQDYCGGSIDFLYTLLSWNSQSAWRTDFSQIEAYITTFADTLHAEFPNAKLKLMGLQVPSITGGMGANYGATGSFYSDTFGMLVTAQNYNDFLQGFANKPNYTSFVEFVSVSTQFDSLYNMPFSQKNVNTRNSSSTEMVGSNGVHPSGAGQLQIADVVYRNLVKSLT